MKKLLSILASVGLIATSSSAVVACSVSNSGSLTINGVSDLHINNADDFAKDANAKPSKLDSYIESKNSWRVNNNQQAPQIQKAIDAFTKDKAATADAVAKAQAAVKSATAEAKKAAAQTALTKAQADQKAVPDTLNAALYNVSLPVFEAKIGKKNHYSFSAEELYNQLNPANVDASDKATKTNKLELKVNMVKLGDIMHVLGLAEGKTLADAIDVHVDAANPINNYVHIKNVSTIASVFTTTGKISSKNLQKIFNRPDKSLKSIKLEISTSPIVVIFDKTVDAEKGGMQVTITGENLEFLTPANVKLLNADGNEDKTNPMIFKTTDQTNTATAVTFTKAVKDGQKLVYTDEDGNTITVTINVK